MSYTATSCKTIKPILPSSYDSSVTFIPVSWTTEDIEARNVWTDGVDMYYSYGYDHYVLNRETVQWEKKTWPISKFYGCNVWTDGVNLYMYSTDEGHYKIDLDSDAWEKLTVTYPGQESTTYFFGSDIWTDGTSIYYSGEVQLVLNNGVWETKEWYGLPEGVSPSSEQVWNDGTNIYLSLWDRHYVLNGDTWEEKIWYDCYWSNEYANTLRFYGSEVWSNGKEICLSTTLVHRWLHDDGKWYHGSGHDGTSWHGPYGEIDDGVKFDNGFTGANVWTDGVNVYYSEGHTQCVLLPRKTAYAFKYGSEWRQITYRH